MSFLKVNLLSQNFFFPFFSLAHINVQDLSKIEKGMKSNLTFSAKCAKRLLSFSTKFQISVEN